MSLRCAGSILLSTAAALCASPAALAAGPSDAPWPRHTIDDSSRGADGVRLMDVNKDGLPDIATGWEEGGITRVYLHPGAAKVKSPWPRVTVGETPSVEDAVFADLDDDGAVDVVSSCEGEAKTVFVHWGPKGSGDYLDARKWTTRPVPVTQGRCGWMFSLPMRFGARGRGLVVGSKGAGGLVGWLEIPAEARDLSKWTLHEWYGAGWIMSLAPADVDGDGDTDVVVSDRKGPGRGVLWLENPGPAEAKSVWKKHPIGAANREVMFLDLADLNGDGQEEIIVAVRQDEIHYFRRPVDPTGPWPCEVIRVVYPRGLGTAKAVAAGDIDGDGKLDLVYSCEHAHPPKRGVVWLRNPGSKSLGPWSVHDVSGPEGIKFDRIELLDLDGDGDLDILTCEERHENRGLGVIWYENPLVSLKSHPGAR